MVWCWLSSVIGVNLQKFVHNFIITNPRFPVIKNWTVTKFVSSLGPLTDAMILAPNC